jgi:uncharacterized protein
VTDTIAVEVVYALAEKQWLRVLRLAPGSRVRDALEASGLVQELALQEPLHLGVHGRRCADDTPLITGDRVEIYRELHFDPMESRRRRAAKSGRQRGG